MAVLLGFMLLQSTNLERHQMVILVADESLMRASGGEFFFLVGIACTITIEHAQCRTIPESYRENKA
jgi:hypothetical protein